MHLRITWVVLSGVLAVILLAIFNQVVDFQQETSLLKQNLEASEIGQTIAILHAIRGPIIAGDREAIQAEFRRLGQFFSANHLMLVDPQGTILADNQIGWSRSPIEISRFFTVKPASPQSQWLTSDQILWVTVPLVDEQGKVLALLINETNQQAKYNRLYQAKTWQAIQFLLFILFIVTLFLAINWWLFIHPLNQIYSLSRAIRQGRQKIRAAGSPVLELQRVNTAFNEMIDHLINQQTALEELNQGLEATVAERTSALESSNNANRSRADQLEAINGLIASTAAALDMNALAKRALDQSMKIMQMDKGMIWISGYHTSTGFSAEPEQQMNLAFQISRQNQQQKLLIDDWNVLPDDHPLVKITETVLNFGVRSSISLPILSNGTLVGLLTLGNAAPRRWTAEEATLLEILAHHLSTAIERTQSVEDLRAHNLQMRELMIQSEQLSRTFTFNEVIETIGECAVAVCKADGLGVFIRSEAHSACAWSRNLSEDFVKVALKYTEEFFPPGTAIDPKPILVPDLQEIGKVNQSSLTTDPTLYRLAVIWPLSYKYQVGAFACFFYNQPRQWQQNDREIIGTFFRQAAASLENARLLESERTQRRMAEALREVSETLNSTLDLDEVLEGILGSLGQVIPHDSADIMLIEGDMVQPVRWHGMPQAYSESLKSWCYPIKELSNRRRILQTAQAIVISDIRQEPTWVRTTGLEWVNSYAGAPICQRGEVTGFIDVMSAQPGFFHEKIGPSLQAFANQAAIALENARLYKYSQQRMEETSALYRAVQPLFNTVEDIAELSRQITKSVTREFSSAHCSILLVNESHTHLALIAQSGSLLLLAPELPLDGPGLTVKAVRTGSMIYSPDVTLEPSYIPGAERSRCELVIPLQADGQVIGVLNLESTKINAFDERERRLFASFAEQAALGLENARLFATIRQNANQMARLNQIAQQRAQEAETLRLATSALSSTLDLQSVLDSILKHLDQVLPHDSACMFLVEDEHHLKAWSARNLPNMDKLLHARFPRNDALLQEVEESLRPVTLQDAQVDLRFNQWGDTSNVHGWMGVPLIAGKEYVGALTLNRLERVPFKREEIDLAQAFANQAAVAVQNARLYAATQQRARELEALHTATTLLVSTLDLQKLLERILAAATQAIPSARTAALHLCDENHLLKMRVQQGLDELEALALDWNDKYSPWIWVLREQRPLLINDASSLKQWVGDLRFPERWEKYSLLIAPLVQEEHPLGVISLITPQPDAFTEQDLQLLISFASTATAAIHNAQLHSAVQYLAVTDPLTKVYNRRGFYEQAQHLLDEAKAFNRPLSAIMIDIDYFKNINDRYGHDAGDAVLEILAERGRKVLRESDLICRYGGEEFTILLAESDLNGAQAAAARLHKSITATPIETTSGPVLITISMGVATLNEPTQTLDQLLKCADKALYLAKDNGRNRIRVWTA